MDLSTRYMGLDLRNPLIASPSPLSHTLDGVRRLADGGVGAIVLHSLFEEQITEQADRDLQVIEQSAESFPEALSYFPAVALAELGPRAHLSLIERAATAIDIPLIASLNGATPEGWTEYARQMQDAGAAAIELNIHSLADDPDTGGVDVEQRQLEIVARVRDAVTVPVAVKLTPYFSSLGELARRLDQAGADALVLFNRIDTLDIDLETLEVVSEVTLSSPADARLPRTWIALLRGRVQASLAATTGVEQPGDLIKYLLAGADVVMTTSSLLRHGPGHAQVLLDGLTAWMARKGFDTVDELRGRLAVGADGDGSAYERSLYVTAVRAANAGAYDRVSAAAEPTSA